MLLLEKVFVTQYNKFHNKFLLEKIECERKFNDETIPPYNLCIENKLRNKVKTSNDMEDSTVICDLTAQIERDNFILNIEYSKLSQCTNPYVNKMESNFWTSVIWRYHLDTTAKRLGIHCAFLCFVTILYNELQND